jgi:hypothetical protein
MEWLLRRLRLGWSERDGFCALGLEEISDDRFGVALRLIEDAHFEGGLFDGFDCGQTGLAFEVGIGRDPGRPPGDLPIPDFRLFIVDYDVEDASGRKGDFDIAAGLDFDAARG